MKSLASLPLSWKLALVPLVLMGVLAATMLVLSEWLLGDFLRERASARVQDTTAMLSARFGNAVDRRVSEAELLARSEALRAGASPDGMRAELDWLASRTKGFAWIGVMDANGTVVAALRGMLEGQSIAHRPVFRHGREGVWLGDVHPAVALAPLLDDGRGGVPELIDIAMPLPRADGSPAGVLGVHVNWTLFRDLRDEMVGTQREGGLQAVILSRDGVQLLGDLPAPNLLALRRALAAEPQPGAPLRYEVAGAAHVASMRPVIGREGRQSLGWQVVTVQDLDAALRPVTALQRSVIASVVLLAAALGGVGALLSRRLSQPYAGLIDAVTQRFEHGGAPAGIGLTDYLDELGEQLKSRPASGRAGPFVGPLVDPLASDALLQRVLRDAQRLRTVMDQLPAPVYLVDAEFQVLYWNEACEHTFGWAAPQALGRRVAELLPDAPRRPPLPRLRERVRGEDGPWRFEAYTLRRDGTEVCGEWRVSKVHGGAGELIGVLAQVRDLSAERRAMEHASVLEHRLQILTDAAVDYAFVELDGQGRVIGANASAERLLAGGAEHGLVGSEHAEHFSPDERALGRPRALREEARRDGRAEFEGWCLRRDGTRFWGEVLVYRLGEPSEAQAGFVQVTRDLGARRATERRAREHEATLAAVLNAASDAVISTDIDGRITLFNPAAERIFGHSAQALLGQPLSTLLPERHRAHHGADLERFAASRVSRRTMGAGRVQGVRADGSVLELEASISQVTVNERQVLTAILRDVTDRVRAEGAMLQYQRELTALTQQLMAQEKETTRRLAQGLHDQLGQTLAAVRLAIDAEGPSNASRRARLEALVDQSIRQVRQVLVDLRPPLLEDHGLAAALDNEVRARYPLPKGVELLLDVPATLARQRWPVDVEYAAFMVAREAIENALRHAGASLVRVSLEGDVHAMHLNVEDDGSGVEPQARAGRPGHLGMVGMRERALAIGARFDVRSPPGEGTRVQLLWNGAPTPPEAPLGTPQRTETA